MKPLLSDHALKQATIRDYKRWAERAGQHVDAQALDTLAVADLQLADAYDRSTKQVVPSAPDPERDQAARKSIDEQAAEIGAEVVTGKLVTRKVDSLHAKSIPGSKWSYAMGRLARILARPALPSRRPWEDCEMPRLAKRVYELKAFIELDPSRQREFIGAERNPFYRLSAVDFERKFRAMTMQICDESTGRMGTWWTPK